MAYLLDSNQLLRLNEPLDVHYRLVRRAVQRLQKQEERLCMVSQNLTEFWNICTRPATARGGFGLSIAETHRRARLLERRFELLPETLAVHEEWRRIVVAYSVSGLQVYDARLVAAMRVHKISHILTFDVGDFARYSDIIAIDPKDV